MIDVSGGNIWVLRVWYLGMSWNGAHPRRSKAQRIADRLLELESLHTLLSYAGPSNGFSDAMKQVGFGSLEHFVLSSSFVFVLDHCNQFCALSLAHACSSSQIPLMKLHSYRHHWKPLRAKSRRKTLDWSKTYQDQPACFVPFRPNNFSRLTGRAMYGNRTE